MTPFANEDYITTCPLGDGFELSPWNRPDGKQYLTLQRKVGKGYRRVAIPLEDVRTIGEALVSADLEAVAAHLAATYTAPVDPF